ncbi:MAG: threonine synthase, partial [Clostridia bacterium]|nr:threonine synthase [Clostridia bacterium]
PFKFSGSVVSAIMGEDDAPLTDDEFLLIEKLSEIGKMTPPKSLAELKDKEVRFPNVTKKEDMIIRVDEFLA